MSHKHIHSFLGIHCHINTYILFSPPRCCVTAGTYSQRPGPTRQRHHRHRLCLTGAWSWPQSAHRLRCPPLRLHCKLSGTLSSMRSCYMFRWVCLPRVSCLLNASGFTVLPSSLPSAPIAKYLKLQAMHQCMGMGQLHCSFGTHFVQPYTGSCTPHSRSCLKCMSVSPIKSLPNHQATCHHALSCCV